MTKGTPTAAASSGNRAAGRADAGAGQQDVLGVCAVPDKPQIAPRAPHGEAPEVGRPLRDRAGEVAARCAGQGRVRHHSLDVLHVARIDGGGGDLDEYLIAVGMGVSTSCTVR